MKTYLLSASVGLLVGAFYAIMHVRSPAPPMVAPVGLCGIYLGELGMSWTLRWIQERCSGGL
jgi:XapX domain-containing protein